MRNPSVPRRSVLQAVVACGGAGLIAGPAQALTEAEKRSLVRKTDPHTKATFRAVIDAVIPRTPELESELGTEHVPGGLENSIDLFMIKYINTLFSFGHPELGRLGNLRLAEILSVVLDLGASKLIFEGENEKPPKLSRALDLLDESWWELDLENLANGPFALLSRTDRLRALGVFDDIEFDTSELPGPLIKGDGGLITQLMVAFTEVVYYSEWEGYESFAGPPGERGFTNDPSAVQSWRQTGYPGITDGFAALRGYWGTPDSSLGGGETYKEIESAQLTYESGQFRENDYDTSDYEEIYPERRGSNREES